MKKLLLPLLCVVLVAVSILTPTSIVSASSAASSESCGDTYTVQNRDNLTKIASYCGTTVASILDLNPQITNPNIIYTGQVLRIWGTVSSSSSYTYTYTVQSGDTLDEIADMFDTTVWAIKTANPSLWYYSIYVGQVLNIPSSSSSGYARVSLSTTQAEAGDSVTVYVRGFPANSYIDYRVGEEDEDYSVVYDSVIDEDGEDSLTITIPSDADEGEYWVVFVTTTSQKDGVEAYSPTIYITD